jgi:hypothetical protein
MAGKHTERRWLHSLFAVPHVDAYTALWRTENERLLSSVNMKQDLYVYKFMFLARPVVDLEVKWTLKCVLLIETYGIWNYTAEILVLYWCENWFLIWSQIFLGFCPAELL